MNMHFCVFYTHLGNEVLEESNYLINVSQARGYLDQTKVSITYDLIFAAQRSINPVGDGRTIADVVDFNYIVQLINNYYNGNDLLKDISLPDDHKKVCDKVSELYDKKLDKDCVCFTCYRPFSFITVYTAILIKKSNPNIDTIVGGPFIELSQKARELFSCLGVFDYVVKGDIENVLEKYITGDLGKDEHFVDYIDMKQLSVPIYYLPEILIKPNLYFNFSRGCPYSCSYCPGSHRNLKSLPINTVISTYQYYDVLLSKMLSLKKKVSFFITDNTFNYSKNRIHNVCDGLIDLGNTFSSQAYFTIGNLNDVLIKKLKDAKFNMIKIGIDTYNDQKSELYNNVSKFNKENIELILDEIVSVGLEIFGKPGLYGMPGETNDIFEEEWEFLCNLFNRYKDTPGFYFMPHMFYFIPGTDVYDNPSKYGVIYENWGDLKCVIPEVNEVSKSTPRYYYCDISNVEYFRRY